MQLEVVNIWYLIEPELLPVLVVRALADGHQLGDMTKTTW